MPTLRLWFDMVTAKAMAEPIKTIDSITSIIVSPEVTRGRRKTEDERRYLSCLLIIVFLSFPAYASTLEFGSSLKTEYNLGDSLSIDGKIISGGEVSGLFQLNIVCNNQATNIVKSKQLRLSIDEQYTFNEVMNLPVNGQGKCLVNGKFDDVDADSHEFTITRDLKGSFDISKANLQLGEGFSFFGSIQKLNDLPMNGLATISIINSGQIYDVNTVEVKNGEMNYSYDAENIPAGRYYISVAANDVFGNERIFDNVAGFDVFAFITIFIAFSTSASLSIYA